MTSIVGVLAVGPAIEEKTMHLMDLGVVRGSHIAHHNNSNTADYGGDPVSISFSQNSMKHGSERRETKMVLEAGHVQNIRPKLASPL